MYWYTTYGKIEIVEQIFIKKHGGEIVRPFSESAEINCRDYSILLERAITDFGSDVSFQRIPQKMQEHYGVSVPISSAQHITEKHAEAIHKNERIETAIPERQGAEIIIAETDGSMIPIVKTSTHSEEEKADRRKTRQVDWTEARLSLAFQPGSTPPIYGTTLGGVNEAGDQLGHCAIKAGAGINTKIHSVGDGAPWIADQVHRKFGTQGSFLIDFYHLCDYLAAAGNRCAPSSKNTWMTEQKEKMKRNEYLAVLAGLEPHLEEEAIPNPAAPVRACYRYISNRPGQFGYKEALAANLPIGSGQVESGHRHVIQERLKISGAWWKPENAENMLSLRVLRANDQWEQYWEDIQKKAA